MGRLFFVLCVLFSVTGSAAPVPVRTNKKVNKIAVDVSQCLPVESYYEYGNTGDLRVRTALPVVYCEETIAFQEKYVRTEGRLFKRDIYELVPGSETPTYKFVTVRESFDSKAVTDYYGRPGDGAADVRENCERLREKLTLQKVQNQNQIKCK